MNICVIGAGYVGLVTGAVFADLGNEVTCVDILEERIKMLQQGKIPIYEPGLEEMIIRNTKDKRLFFSSSIAEGVKKAEIIFICVGTPPRANGETDLAYVEAAAKDIAEAMDSYKIVVNKSTVPVGTGDFVRSIIEKHKKVDTDFAVVSNPEFLREGSAIQDTLCPDRIVIGAPDKKVAMKLLELYATLGRPMLITDVYSAEMIKYASNAFLATKISFINAIANICEKAGANVADVTRGMGYDSRIGPDFLAAGLGFGGSCFPKDLESLVQTSAKLGYNFDLLRAVIAINKGRGGHFFNMIKERMSPLAGKVLGILGLAFKPNTDDMRDAKSIEIIGHLLKEGALIKAYDPAAMENAKQILPNITYCSNAYEAAKGADALVVITDWREFKLLNMERLRELMRLPVIFDGRNIYDLEKKRRLGFEYYSIGRGNTTT